MALFRTRGDGGETSPFFGHFPNGVPEVVEDDLLEVVARLVLPAHDGLVQSGNGAFKGAQFVRRTFRRALAGGNNAFYGLYYTAQGLFQLGGEAWAEFEPWMYETYFKKQQPDGSWNGEIGQVYCTSMAVLAFTVPYRMLPIYQRDETVDADETGEENRK